MRNLKLLYEQIADLELDCNYFTVDNETGRFYIASDGVVIGYNSENFAKVFELNLLDANLDFATDVDVKVVGLQYLCGEEQICFAFQHGDIVLCGTSDKNIECVGTLDCKIDSMCWSPDQEVVLFVTNRGSVVVMNHDFDPITELEITSDVFGEGDFVNVGWGSKETQFQGSKGKFVPEKNKKAEFVNVAQDDNQVKIVWRGDGQYFAISNVENSSRKFRVWNRSCELQYTSEGLPGLESCFAWKPSGSLIASSQRKVHRHDIIFFELNGLQHGEFTLPFKADQVLINKLEWNCDSTILLLWATDLHNEQTYLQLWTVSNYHWYLKQSLELEKVSLLAWDTDEPYQLHVFFQNKTYKLYHWSWCTDTSKLYCSSNQRSKSVHCSSCVGVIDGTILKVTPFQTLVVPPPMCAFNFQFKENIKMVCFGFDCNAIGVLLNSGTFISFSDTKSEFCDNEIVIELMACGGNGFTSQLVPFVVDGIFKPNKNNSDLPFDWWANLRHLLWPDEDKLVAVACSGKVDYVLELHLDRSTSQIACSKSFMLNDFIVGMCSGTPLCTAVVQLKTGEVLRYSNELTPYRSVSGEKVTFSYLCPSMQLCRFSNEEFGLVALSLQNRLFLDNAVLSTISTSFCIHKDYLLYTTSSHKLVFVSKFSSITDLQKNTAMVNTSTKSCNKEMCRSVERGARLVVVTPYDTKVVMQLPRGNLEVIHPRPLIISLVKSDLDHLKYREAFVLMRKHRIDLNLIHDHDSAKFFGSITFFVQELNSVEYLNLFLSELREENVTQSMYSQFYRSQSFAPKSLLASSVSKVDQICNAVIVEIEKYDKIKYFLSILTAYVRKSTPEIEKALSQLSLLKEEKPLNDSLLSDALRHLHVMVDGRILYQEALGTYDLDLALTVAQVSNNDPKEYIPFLNELKELEENLKRYRIDMHLKKYDRALRNISKCPEHFSECIELVKEQGLHREALTLFKQYTAEYYEISSLYAEELMSQGKYEEAGIVLARCENYKRAIVCFASSGSWQHALNCASSLHYSQANYLKLAKSLADTLISKNKFLDAAFTLEEVGEFHEAVDVLLKGRLWSDALRMIRLHELSNMIDTHVLICLKQAYQDVVSHLKEYREQFDRYCTRLFIVRELKQQKAIQALNSGDGGDLESDIVSDFGSTLTGSSQSSLNSRTSQKTAKSRRKQERKRFSLREGSRFEEEGLLQALHEVYRKMKASDEDIHALLLHLSLFFMDNEASALQTMFESTRKLFAQGVTKIWPEPDPSDNASVFGAQSTVNSILASRFSTPGNQAGYDHLEIRIPPKFISVVKAGMHMYTNKTKAK